MLAALRGAWRRFTGADVLEEVLRVGAEVRALTMEGARSQAYSILEDRERYRATQSCPSAQESDVLKELAPGLREFFTHYERIQPVYSDTDYNRATIGASECLDGYVRVARSVEHTELVVRLGHETVYETDGTEGALDESARMPSIFHWVVLEERLTKD